MSEDFTLETFINGVRYPDKLYQSSDEQMFKIMNNFDRALSNLFLNNKIKTYYMGVKTKSGLYISEIFTGDIDWKMMGFKVIK